MNPRLFATLERILWLAIWVALGAYAALTLWIGILGLTYPYQLDYGEGIVLWFAQEIARGHSIYLNTCCASSNYPPLAMLLPRAIFPTLDGYMAGRLTNFSAAILVAVLIFDIVASEQDNSYVGWLAALFFFGSTYIYHWAPLYRADLLGLGFAFAGIYFVWKREQMPDNRRPAIYLLFAVVGFLLALYTKQTLVAAPAAAFLALFRREKRTAILFALALGVTGGAIYLAIDLITRGGFTFGLIDSNATIFLPEQLFDLLKTFAITFAPLLFFALWEWVRRVRSGQWGVWEAYAATTLATLLFAGRVGAWENYFFEAVAVVCVLAGFRIAEWRLEIRDRRSLRFTFYVLLWLQLALYTRDHDPRVAANLVAQDAPANRELAALLARTNGTIISEDMGALVTSGKDVAYYTFQYSSLARAGKWNQSWELNGLRDGIFPLVVLEKGTREDVDHYRRFTREFVSTLDRYYERSLVIGKYEIYKPAPSLTLQPANFGDAISLIGWSLPTSNFQSPISNLQFSVVWQAQRAIPRRYTVFVHLVNEQGAKVTQDDREPRGGNYPTTRWTPSEFVRENYVLTVPQDLSRGKYFLRVGWYDAATGERLPVPGSEDNSFVITTLEIK